MILLPLCLTLAPRAHDNGHSTENDNGWGSWLATDVLASPRPALGKVPSNANIDGLDRPMTRRQVRALLGRPDSTSLSKCDEKTKRAPWRCLTWEYRDSQRKANRAAGRHFLLAPFQEGRGERYWLHGRESRTSNETRLIASPKRTNGPLARAPATRSASAKLNSDRARSTERRAGEQILNHRQPMGGRLPPLYAQQRYRVPSDDTQCQFKR